MIHAAHFNTYPHGGAFIAARRLCEGLERFQVDCRIYWSECDREIPDDPSILRMPVIDPVNRHRVPFLSRSLDRRRRKGVSEAWANHVAGRSEALEVFSLAEQYTPAFPDWNAIRADIVHLHWIAFMADWPAFFGSMPATLPIVWTLHDQNAFTGGCHYSGGCKRFIDGCGICPQLRNPSSVDASARTWNVRRRAISGRNIQVVSPSRWLDKLARQSRVWPSETDFSVIPYGIPASRFRSIDKLLARNSMGLHDDCVVIGFGAENMSVRRKGMQELVAAFQKIENRTGKKVYGLSIGNGELPPVEGATCLHRIHDAGFLSSIEDQSRFYSACDFMVLPSLEDNQPQMGLESLACGTPVVAFDTGGIAEFIQPGVSGLLAKAGDSTSLAKAVSEMMHHDEMRITMGRRGKMLIHREFSMERQAESYRSLYQEVARARMRKSA